MVLSDLSLADFHMHTRFCDGRDEPETMVEAALKLGMKRMGFSGHSCTPFDDGAGMTIEGTEIYKREIARLKEKYAGRIEIFCGTEQEYFSDTTTDGYDYVIGSITV